MCHNECDAINDYVKCVNQSNVIATSTVISTCNVLRDKNDLNIDNKELALNATSLVKGKLEGDQNVTNISTNAHLTKMKHQPLLQGLSNQNKPNATSIMATHNDNLIHFPSTLVEHQDDLVDLGVRPQDYKKLNNLLGEYKDVFPQDLPMGLPPERAIKHSIETMANTKPISKPPYWLSHIEAAKVEK